jgi:hypothetical protein
MAQTKTRGSKKSSPASTRSRSRSRKPQRSSKARSTKPQSSVNNRLRDAQESVEKTGKKVGRDVGKAASKAKTPLLASSAALAGAAGGLAIGAMRSRRSHRGLMSKALHPKRVKISSQDVAKAARGIGTVSQHVADLTSEMNGERRPRNGKRKSPVEVVLEGLTSRR